MMQHNQRDWAMLALILACLGASIVNLLFIGIPGNPFVVLTCAVAAILLLGHGRLLTLSSSEYTALFGSALVLTLFGAADYDAMTGLSFNINAVAAGLVLLSAYVIARYLLARRLAYPVAVVGFLVILIPSSYIVALGSGKLNELIVYGSENFATSWLIITSLSMCAVRMAENKPPPLWPLALTFLIALTQYTRGSILVSFMSLLGVAYIRLGLKWTIALAGAGVIASIPFGGEIIRAIEEAITQTKFGRWGLDSPRWIMWQSYLDYQTLGSFLLGTDTDFVPIIKDFNGNPHSSFIRFHAYFGIVPFAAALALLLRAAILSRSHIILLVAFMLLRAASDILLVGTVLDLFFMMAFVPMILASGVTSRRAGSKRITIRRPQESAAPASTAADDRGEIESETTWSHKSKFQSSAK